MRQRIHFCKTHDNFRIAYARSGDGPPLVKTASWLTHLEHEWDTPVWGHWLSGLSSQHTLFRYDPRGSGLSDREIGNVNLDTMVSDLEAVVDAAGLERFPLLGSCQGGPVAIAYAARHPERISCLILFGSYIRGAYTWPVETRQYSEAHALEKLIEIGWGHDVPAFRQVFSSLLMPGASLKQIQALADLEHVSTSARSAAKFWHAFHSFDVTDEIGQVQTQSLVIHTRGDAMVPFEEGRKVASTLPGARLVMLEGRNHILLENEPAWHQFLQEVHAFLQEDEQTVGNWRDENNRLSQLTRREQEVLDLVAQGLNNEEVAGQLFISQRTVRNHLTNIFCKLDVTRRAQAIVQAREAGLGRRTSSATT